MQMALCRLLLVCFTHFDGLNQGYSLIFPHPYILICVFCVIYPHFVIFMNVSIYQFHPPDCSYERFHTPVPTTWLSPHRFAHKFHSPSVPPFHTIRRSFSRTTPPRRRFTSPTAWRTPRRCRAESSARAPGCPAQIPGSPARPWGCRAD